MAAPVVLLLLALALVPTTAAAAAAPARASSAREIRSLTTGEFGVSRPVGLTYVPRQGALLIAGAGGRRTGVLRLSLTEDALGSFRLPKLSHPATLAFDAAGNRLTAVSGDALLSVPASELRSQRPSLRRSDVGGLGLRDPQGATFDPASGTWFVLDAGSDTIVRVPVRGTASRISLRGLGAARLQGMALNPADGLLYVASPSEDLLYGLDGTGAVRKTFRLGSVGLRDLRAMVIAPSADPTDDPATMHLYVADAGDASTFGRVAELSLSPAVAPSSRALTVTVTVTGTLVQTIQTGQLFPSIPDPGGIAYMTATDRLEVADSEVEEMAAPINQGKNLFTLTRTGTLEATAVTTAYSNEPTGLGYSTAAGGTLYISDDDANKVFIDQPPYGSLNGSINTAAFPAPASNDPEGVEYDPNSGHVFVADGVGIEVWDVDPVDGIFGNGNDVVTHFDVAQFGVEDAEGIGQDVVRDLLLVIDPKTRKIYEITKGGSLVRIVDVSGITGNRLMAGVTMAPSSNPNDAPSVMNYYISDRMVDNNADPNENDGRIYEVSVAPSDTPPTVVLTDPAEGATVSGSVLVRANATDDVGVTQVEFFVDGTSIGFGTEGPAGVWTRPTNWDSSSVGDGSHTITATATDSAAQTASDSNIVSVDNVDSPPTVTLTDPGEGTTVGGTITLRATATDDVGMASVEFFGDGTSVGFGTEGPTGVWTGSWSTVGADETVPHTITATATDSAAHTASDSNAVSVDNTDPTASITSPLAGDTVSGVVTVTANASDNQAVASVEFFADGASIGFGTQGPPGVWTRSWNTVGSANGPHTLTAVAADGAANTGTSAGVQVTVDNPLVLDIPIATGLDDVEEGPTGSINTTSTDLDMITDNTTVQRAVGLRFTGIGIPQGATITNAYIQFRADETSSDPTSLTIKGEDADDAAPFGTGNSNVTNRTTTTASVPWPTPPASNIPSWTAGNQGSDQLTPDISAVIQEIVDRTGWTPGNDVVLILTGSGRRVAESFEGGVSFAPVLHIEYGPSDTSPTVTLTDPAEGATVSGSVLVRANATDDVGVTSVEFFVDGASIGSGTEGPAGVWTRPTNWDSSTVGDGSHTISATATDSAAQTASDSNTVTVDNVDSPPTVTLTDPGEGTTVGGTITLRATATDDVAMASVEFFVDGTPIGPSVEGPLGVWTLSWNSGTVGDGSRTITATATDSAAHTASDSNTVSVDNTDPTASITSPLAGNTVSGVVTVTANASDNQAVASVEFFADGASIGFGTEGPAGVWTRSWNTVASANGPHTLTAVASDGAANTGTSAGVQVTVDNPLFMDIPIAAGLDDIEERLNGNMYTNSTDLDMMNDKTNVMSAVGLRFVDVGVPQGATITNAYIQFQADEVDSLETNLTIRGEDSDFGAPFTTVKFSLTNRTPTTASVPWPTPPAASIPAWTAVGLNGLEQRTPDISAVIQEIVDRPLWNPGYAMVLIITGSGERVAEAFEGGAPPVLHIEYAI